MLNEQTLMNQWFSHFDFCRWGLKPRGNLLKVYFNNPSKPTYAYVHLIPHNFLDGHAGRKSRLVHELMLE